MKKSIIGAFAIAALVTATSTSLFAQDETAAPSPPEIVAQADSGDWLAIAPEDLLVMALAPAADGSQREVVIQLMPAPFSQGWVQNIRTLARAEWYDGISINRVQDNYVVQWGDPNHDNPEAEGEAKPLPAGLQTMTEEDYTAATQTAAPMEALRSLIDRARDSLVQDTGTIRQAVNGELLHSDPYSQIHVFSEGWPLAFDDDAEAFWPVHCYGMVGVGRGMSPDTGSGAELYTVIGHAPRHLDRNIALVGRVIEGMEHLSSLPRGSGALGFYTEDEFDKRTPIRSIRVASDLPPAERPQFEYLSTDSETFAHYAQARSNRRDPFFIVPAGGADVCNIPVPVRAVETD